MRRVQVILSKCSCFGSCIRSKSVQRFEERDQEQMVFPELDNSALIFPETEALAGRSHEINALGAQQSPNLKESPLSAESATFDKYSLQTNDGILSFGKPHDSGLPKAKRAKSSSWKTPCQTTSPIESMPQVPLRVHALLARLHDKVVSEFSMVSDCPRSSGCDGQGCWRSSGKPSTASYQTIADTSVRLLGVEVDILVSCAGSSPPRQRSSRIGPYYPIR
eukprot:388813-Amphidinium_carterae.3